MCQLLSPRFRLDVLIEKLPHFLLQRSMGFLIIRTREFRIQPSWFTVRDRGEFTIDG